MIGDFQTAAAAGEPPDIQFFWNGIYHMESVWLGYVEPAQRAHRGRRARELGRDEPSSVFGGQQYRVGWYDLGARLGLQQGAVRQGRPRRGRAHPPPGTRSSTHCDKLKASGVTPLGGGIKDGFWGEWYLDQSLTQQLDTPGDAINLFIGELDWRDPRYHEHWVKLRGAHNGGYINDDINSLDLYAGDPAARHRQGGDHPERLAGPRAARSRRSATSSAS